MIRALLVATAGLAGAGTLAAQTLHGTIIEDGTTAPIAGVIVELRTADGTRFANGQTNAHGAFLLSVRRSGSYTLHLVHLGYQPIDSDTFTVRADETIRMELRMARTTIPLEPLVVTARSSGHLQGFRERMRRPGPGRFITREEIERRPAAQVTELLREQPGVEVIALAPPRYQQPVGAEYGGHIGPKMNNVIYLRSGRGRCRPTVFVDAMIVEQLDDLSGIDDLLRPDFIEGVEIYTGATAPPPLHARDGCGVVAFWTRQSEGGSGWSWRKLGGGLSGFALAVLASRALAR